MSIVPALLIALAQEGWTEVENPCGGSRTAALWFDDRKTGYLGRGEAQEGKGLFRTKDGGRTWEAMPAFAKTRVNDIRRGPDGRLYGAGWNTESNCSAWVVEEKGFEPRKLFQPGDSVWTAVTQGENVAVTDDGQVFVDSLTGVTFAYRASGGEFVEGRSFLQEALADPEAPGWQVRRVVAYGGRFYACGSLINEPAMVFLPSKDPKATFHLTRLELQPSNEDGELMDLHLWSAKRAIVVGTCQTTHAMLAYLADGDLHDRKSWKRVDFAASGIAFDGWIRSISVQGETVVAVGEKVPTAQGGFVLVSEDGGTTWKNRTPTKRKVGPLSKVWLFENGDRVVAGGGGEMWIYEKKK